MMISEKQQDTISKEKSGRLIGNEKNGFHRTFGKDVDLNIDELNSSEL